MNMQAFYKKLSTAETPTGHQQSLAALTRITRAQILEATHELTWMIWSAERDTISA